MRLERGPLSTDEFKKFSGTVVPFLHVTTHIEGRKYDDLLYDKGGNSHPTILFLDASGGTLAKVSGRTVKDWARVKRDIDRYYALRKKAASGDTAAQIEVALFECLLGRIDYDTLEEVLEGRKLTEAQKKQVRSLELDVEVREARQMLRAARGSKDAFESVGEDLAVAFRKSETPASDDLRGLYLTIVARYAIIKSDAALAKAAIDKLAERFGSDDARVKRLLRRAERMEKSAK